MIFSERKQNYYKNCGTSLSLSNQFLLHNLLLTAFFNSSRKDWINTKRIQLKRLKEVEESFGAFYAMANHHLKRGRMNINKSMKIYKTKGACFARVFVYLLFTFAL